MANKYNNGLDKNPANHSALTPLSFLQRSATVFTHKTAVIDDDMTLTYQALFQRYCRMAAALQSLFTDQGVHFALRHAQRAYILEKGQVVHETSSEALRHDAEIQNRFLSVA